MNIEQAKTISLQDILSKLGYEASKKTNTEVWFLSPFRSEKTPSFKVDLKKNLWYDFGEGKGGDIIDFACTYLKNQNVGDTVSDGLRFIGNIAGEVPRITPVKTYDSVTDGPKLAVVDVRKIEHPALEKYLEKRGIGVNVASQYLKQVRVKNKETGSTMFALGMKNEEDGYEIRNPFFKGCAGPKDVSFIRGTVPKPEGVHIFEGFMDFLSVVTDIPDGKLDSDAIILNSLSCMDKATPYIKGYGYRIAWTWMDNDPAGERARKSLDEFFKTEEGLEHRPMNSSYEGYKDVNDWHISKPPAPQP